MNASSSTSRLRLEHLAWLSLLLVAALLRVYDLGARVMSHDESIHSFYGYELLRRARTLDHANAERMPAIALTAFARSEDRTRALNAGYSVHLSKPIDPAELLATVASVARRN